MCNMVHMQVDVEVESVDRGGNFIGWLYVEGRNLTQLLVEEGLGKVHVSADRWVGPEPLVIITMHPFHVDGECWGGGNGKSLQRYS